MFMVVISTYSINLIDVIREYVTMPAGSYCLNGGRRPGPYLVYCVRVCVLFRGRRVPYVGNSRHFCKTVLMNMSNIMFEVAKLRT